MNHFTRSSLLGIVAALAVTTGVQAADLHSDQAGLQYTKISGYHAAFNATGGYIAAFYYEPTKQHRRFYTAQFELSAKHSIGFSAYDSVSFGIINEPPSAGTVLLKTSEGVWPGHPSLAQKLMSSASYRGTPAHGFHHVLGKIPMFATKMLA